MSVRPTHEDSKIAVTFILHIKCMENLPAPFPITLKNEKHHSRIERATRKSSEKQNQDKGDFKPSFIARNRSRVILLDTLNALRAIFHCDECCGTESGFEKLNQTWGSSLSNKFVIRGKADSKPSGHFFPCLGRALHYIR